MAQLACDSSRMSTNTTPEVSTETINYFDENFQKEGLNYVKFDLIRQIETAKSDYDFYDNQANQFARMAQAQKDKIEGLRYELAAVNAAKKHKTAGII